MKAIPDIIIIDDDPAMTTLIAEYLADSGLIIETHNHAIDGLTAVIESCPRIVFVGLKMNNMRGDQLIVKLSEKYIFQTTSVFLITGEILSEFEHMKLMTLGFDAILKKPASASDVKIAVESIFGHLKQKQVAA